MLYLIATPIGNRQDITLRALTVLKEVDYVLAEDTRKTGLLLKCFDIDKPLVSFFEHNEQKRIPRVLADLEKGNNVALVSSAGSPTISDPGFRLVRECRRKNIPVTSLPGASSLINALVLSSLPHDKFTFLGYAPRKKSQRVKLFKQIETWECPVVFFESPFRLVSSLEKLIEAIGNRRVTIAREMTKKFEQILEDSAEEALVYFRQRKPKGEIVVIISPDKATG